MTETDPNSTVTIGVQPSPFTAEEAKEMVRVALAPGSPLKLPTAPALTELAFRLSHLRMWAAEPTVELGGTVGVLSDPAPLKIAEELAGLLGPWRAAIAYYLKHHGGVPSEYESLVALKTLSQALAKAIPHLQPAPRQQKSPGSWHKVVHFAERVFRTAMRSSNPNRTLGITNDGPVTSFVAVVVARIYGKDVSASSVAKYLKRHAASGKRIFLPAPPPWEAMRYLKGHPSDANGPCRCPFCAVTRYLEARGDKL